MTSNIHTFYLGHKHNYYILNFLMCQCRHFLHLDKIENEDLGFLCWFLSWYCKILISDDQSMNEVLDPTNFATKYFGGSTYLFKMMNCQPYLTLSIEHTSQITPSYSKVWLGFNSLQITSLKIWKKKSFNIKNFYNRWLLPCATLCCAPTHCAWCILNFWQRNPDTRYYMYFLIKRFL